MAYRVDMNDMFNIERSCSAIAAQWNKDASDTFNAVNELYDYQGFTGTAADSVKSYFREVHGCILAALIEIFNTYGQTFFLYRDGYNKDIDSSIYAVLKEEELRQFKERFINLESRMSDVDRDLRGTIDSVDSIVYLQAPSASRVLDNYRELYTRAENLDRKIQSYESDHKNDLSIVDQLIQETTKLIDQYNSSNRHVAFSYHSGDIGKSPGFMNFCVALSASQQYRVSVQSEYLQAVEREQVRVDQRNADLAEERKKKGTWEMIGAGVAIVVGVAAIVCTAGAATPLVATAAVVAGGCSIAYGASNMIEGVQDFYYGANGDITTAAFNPICDTIFQGNRELYDFWGQANMIVASACIPTGNVASNLAQQGVKMSGDAALKVFGVNLGTRVAGKAVGYAAGEIAEEFGANETEKKVINIATSVASTVLLNQTVGKDLINQVEMQQVTDASAKMAQAREILQGVRDGDISVEVPDGKGLLYSGNIQGEDGQLYKISHSIQEFAKENGLRTLESTEAGKMMEDLELYKTLTKEAADGYWGSLSGEFAEHLTGEVSYVAPDYIPTSIFGSIEKPLVESAQQAGTVTDFSSLADEFLEFLTKK